MKPLTAPWMLCPGAVIRLFTATGDTQHIDEGKDRTRPLSFDPQAKRHLQRDKR